VTNVTHIVCADANDRGVEAAVFFRLQTTHLIRGKTTTTTDSLLLRHTSAAELMYCSPVNSTVRSCCYLQW